MVAFCLEPANPPVVFGDDGKVPVGAQRQTVAAPPRATGSRCLRPDGDIYYPRHAPDPAAKPIVLLHCPGF